MYFASIKNAQAYVAFLLQNREACYAATFSIGHWNQTLKK